MAERPRNKNWYKILTKVTKYESCHLLLLLNPFLKLQLQHKVFLHYICAEI